VTFLENELCRSFHRGDSIASLKTLAQQAIPTIQKLLKLDLEQTLATCQFLKDLLPELDRPRPQTPRAKTAKGLVAVGARAQRPFDDVLRKLLVRPNSSALPLSRLRVGPVKTLERLQAKMDELKTNGKDPMCVFDINRATVVCSNPDEFNHIIGSIAQFFYSLIKVKNKFNVEWESVNDPPCIFYQLAMLPCDDVNGLLEKDTNWIVEVQVTTPQILQTKELCHVVYELTRADQRPSRCPLPTCHRDVQGNS